MQPGTARSLRVVLIVVMATVLVVALGRLVGASPRAAIPRILEPPSPVVPTPAPQSDTSLVQTATGTVRGKVEWDHRLFAGIPYAAPPVGPLRFRPPAPAPAWDGIRDATEPGPRCIQDPSADPEFGKQSDEDCLSLNVWTPAMKGSPRPVMVWIHGGSFTGGSGKIYDGRWLVSRGDVIVVTINYRLGTLGFLAHPALGPPGDVGNYGLQDQQAALRWVRDNIANFGGDPDKVTVAGESAGGMSVCDHLVAPGSKGLFRAAIIQSAPCGAQADLPTAEQRSVDYAAEVGCGDPKTAADCLRALPLDKLREPVTFYNIGEDALPGPVTGSAALPGRSGHRDRRERRGAGAGADGHEPRRVHILRRAAVPAVRRGLHGRAVSGTAAGHVRRQRCCGRRALPAEQLRRQCAVRRIRRRSPTGCSRASPNG